MTFPVHVAFSMWTVLPLSPLVPTCVGWGRVWVSLQFLISRRRGRLLHLPVKLGPVYTSTPSLRKSPLGSPDSSPLQPAPPWPCSTELGARGLPKKWAINSNSLSWSYYPPTPEDTSFFFQVYRPDSALTLAFRNPVGLSFIYCVLVLCGLLTPG